MSEIFDFDEARSFLAEKRLKEFDKKRGIHTKSSEPYFDCAPCENCQNDSSFGAVCIKCNKCGRFNKKEK